MLTTGVEFKTLPSRISPVRIDLDYTVYSFVHVTVKDWCLSFRIFSHSSPESKHISPNSKKTCRSLSAFLFCLCFFLLCSAAAPTVLLSPSLLLWPVLTGFSRVGQTGAISLSIDGHNSDGVAGVWQKVAQDCSGGALRHHFLKINHILCFQSRLHNLPQGHYWNETQWTQTWPDSWSCLAPLAETEHTSDDDSTINHQSIFNCWQAPWGI